MNGSLFVFVPGLNAYLFGCLVLLLFWAAVGIATRLRRPPADLHEFWWGSLSCTLLGFTEPLFVPAYWHPPSILRLGRLDLESFLFCFAVGGIAAVLPEITVARRFVDRAAIGLWNTQHRIRSLPLGRVASAEGSSLGSPGPSSPLRTTPEERRQDHALFLTFALAVFGTAAHLRVNIIYVTSITSLALGAFIAWRTPRLRWQVIAGGFSFLVLYAVVLRITGAVHPDFYMKYWNLPALSGLWFLGAPVEEYLFAFTLGTFWAPLYESLRGRT